MRKGLVLLCLMGIPCASVAQSGPSAWSNLNGLRSGQKIQIVETNSIKHTGAFESVSSSAISIRDATGEASIQRQNVRIVKLMENHHRLRNTLILTGTGAGAGAIAGFALGEAQNKGSNEFKIITTGEIAAAGTLGGAFVGAIVGALLPSHDTIYNVNAH